MMSRIGEWFKRSLSRACAILLAGAVVITPTMAQENVVQNNPSDWAIDTIIEGQNYGIYPLEWHEDFKTPITPKQLGDLKIGIGQKIGEIEGVYLDNWITVFDIKECTRGAVITHIFKALAAYHYSIDLGMENSDAITYMEEHQIASGTNLDKACTIEEAIVIATRAVDYIYQTLDAGSRGYFFKVDGGKNPVYLLGSIHIADSRLYPFNHEILEIYNASDVVGFEIDILDKIDYEKFAELAVYSDGTTLKDHVSAETYELIMAYSEDLGLSKDEINHFKPWYLSNYVRGASIEASKEDITIEEAIDYGIDNYFYYKAYDDEKEIIALESHESQAKVLDSFSDKLQEYLLVGNLYNLIYVETYYEDNCEALDEAELTALNDTGLILLKTGDVEGFKVYYDIDENYLVEEDLTKEYVTKLITNRDIGMKEKIEGYLMDDTGDTYFIILGAAHYINSAGNSVIDQLKAEGYTVTQIK